MKTLKTLFLSTVMILLMSVSIGAEPFLVCDPAPEGEKVTSYVLTINGAEVETVAPMHYDLVGLPAGDYEITARAKNVWEVSEISVPLNFTKAPPSVPAGMELSSQ